MAKGEPNSEMHRSSVCRLRLGFVRVPDPIEDSGHFAWPMTRREIAWGATSKHASDHLENRIMSIGSC